MTQENSVNEFMFSHTVSDQTATRGKEMCVSMVCQKAVIFCLQLADVECFAEMIIFMFLLLHQLSNILNLKWQ